MKYNKSYNGEDFQNYILYLKSIKNKLSKSIYEFVSDINRHNFSEKSLHDSWIKTIQIETNFEKRFSNINIIFTGAYHDREFHFYFEEVKYYKIIQELQDINRDLISFEIGVENNFYDKEQLVFRAQFGCNEHEIEIYANDIKVIEKIKKNLTQF